MTARNNSQSAYVCAKPGCGVQFVAKVSDRKRGWARFCSKSCAAWVREKKLDRRGYSGERHYSGLFEDEHQAGMDAQEAGWDGHKNAF